MFAEVSVMAPLPAEEQAKGIKTTWQQNPLNCCCVQESSGSSVNRFCLLYVNVYLLIWYVVSSKNIDGFLSVEVTVTPLFSGTEPPFPLWYFPWNLVQLFQWSRYDILAQFRSIGPLCQSTIPMGKYGVDGPCYYLKNNLKKKKQKLEAVYTSCMMVSWLPVESLY